MEAWQRTELTVVTAKVVIYEAFVEGKLLQPLARTNQAQIELIRLSRDDVNQSRILLVDFKVFPARLFQRSTAPRHKN